MRSSMMDALAEDYIRTARAKGPANRRVLYGHALRNALIPILTLLGLSLPAIVSGALITETVFNYPGMGLLTVQAAFNDDIPLVLGTTLVITVATVIGSLLADILYAVADPRIRFGGATDMTDAMTSSSTRSSTTTRPSTRCPSGRSSMRRAITPTGRGVGARGRRVAPTAAACSVQIGRVFVENKLAVVGLGVIIFMVLFCFVGPHICTTPTRPTPSRPLLSTRRQNAPPGNGHPLGTDEHRLRHPRPAHVRRSDVADRRVRLGLRRHRGRRPLRRDLGLLRRLGRRRC